MAAFDVLGPHLLNPLGGEEKEEERKKKRRGKRNRETAKEVEWKEGGGPPKGVRTCGCAKARKDRRALRTEGSRALGGRREAGVGVTSPIGAGVEPGRWEAAVEVATAPGYAVAL
ncbi:MAG: hypothetical protein ACT4TC_05690, partial [Myxococcaceae bacterium]